MKYSLYLVSAILMVSLSTSCAPIISKALRLPLQLVGASVRSLGAGAITTALGGLLGSGLTDATAQPEELEVKSPDDEVLTAPQ